MMAVGERRFEGRAVIVTGAGKDIGRFTAQRFAAEGADVMLIGRRLEPLEETQGLIEADGGKAWPFVADVTHADQVQAAVDAAVARGGRIDVVINNAGNRDRTPFLEVEEENWDDVLATNLKAPFLLSQRAARVMAASGGGVILHTASIDATGGDGPYASYSASKAALLGLNRTMALELAQYGIRVNCVSPGYVQSSNLALAMTPEQVSYLEKSFARVPMNRLVRREEVAAAFAFLASDDAAGITGIELKVDCGMTANMYILETLPDGESTVAGSR